MCLLTILQFNFVGRILGPRGMTTKDIEQNTGCKIMIRGKGSMRDRKKVSVFFQSDIMSTTSKKLTRCYVLQFDTPRNLMSVLCLLFVRHFNRFSYLLCHTHGIN